MAVCRCISSSPVVIPTLGLRLEPGKIVEGEEDVLKVLCDVGLCRMTRERASDKLEAVKAASENPESGG